MTDIAKLEFQISVSPETTMAALFAMVQEIKELRSEVAAIREAGERTARVLDKVTLGA